MMSGYLGLFELLRRSFIRVFIVFLSLFLVIYINSFSILKFFYIICSIDHLVNVNLYLTDSFMLYIYFSLYLSSLFAIIHIYIEIYLFVYDALYEQELRLFKRIYFLSMFMYIFSIIFVYLYIIPMIIKVLLFDEVYIRIISVIDGIFSLFYIFYIVMQFPVLLYILVKFNIVELKLLKNLRRHFIIISLFLAACITPPDILSQVIVASILFVIYEIIIFFFDK